MALLGPTLSNFPPVKSCLRSIHLVEAGPTMRASQARALVPDGDIQLANESKDHKEIGFEGPLKGMRKDGVQVEWWGSLGEFFDALPIHRFELTSAGWREILIDIEESNESPYHFRYVLSASPTVASAAYTEDPRFKGLDVGVRIEFCPEAASVTDQIARRVERSGGGALIVDYGRDGASSTSLRAIKNHKYVHVLSSPGTSDLSTDVDYAMIKMVSERHSAPFGPITQSRFLHSLGIRERLQALLRSAKSEEVFKDLVTQYERLTAPDQMGDIYKVLAIVPKDSPVPVGFAEIPEGTAKVEH
ncbi:NADH dehydrogenase [ubiquinone] complex I, assembly factor 7 [Gonapodya sp. JEL0774]|nr:NADH dehydrogenase [ubiquinone] complex I, assembly factor 7 [Gonapodya sp. JEL0774]